LQKVNRCVKTLPSEVYWQKSYVPK